MVNVVYIVPCLIKAGPENVLYDIISHLDFSRFHVTVITLKKELNERNIRPDFEKLGINIISLNTSFLEREFLPFLLAKSISRRISQFSNVIVHAHTYHPTIIASYLREFKTITTIHNISLEDFVSLKGPIFGRYMSYRYNNALGKISVSVAISEYMMDFYNPYCRELKKIVNGVSFHKCYTAECEALLNEKVNKNLKYIVVVGRLSRRKNVLYIINELMALKRFDFRCYFVGLGEELENCIKLIGDDSRFCITGYRSNVQDYLSAADLFLSASKSEGMPLSVLEALNVGVPALLSDIPPHREIVHDMNMPSVGLFDLLDGELSRQIVTYLDESYDGDKIAERARQVFSADVMAVKYENLYESLV